MSPGSRKIAIVASAGAGLLTVRSALPPLLTWLANRGLRKISGYLGHIERVGLRLTTPALTIHGLSLARLNGHRPALFLDISSVIAMSDWKKFFAGTIYARVRIESPRLRLNFDGRQAPALAAKPRPGSHNGLSWRDQVSQLPPFILSSALVTDGEIHLLDLPGQNGADIAIDHLNLRLANFTNSTEIASTVKARVDAKARVMSKGFLDLHAEGYPLTAIPTFNVDFLVSNLDLTELQTLIEKNLQLEVRRGTVSLYLEAAAADGQIRGYVNPIFDHLELEPPRAASFVGKIKARAVELLATLGRNRARDRIATCLDFEGRLPDPELNFTEAVRKFLRNSFLTAGRAALESRIWFSRAGAIPQDVEIHDEAEPRTKLGAAFHLLKETFSAWNEVEAPRMAAALSYYTAFSMAPLLILAISIAGLVLGRDAAEGKIVAEIGGLVGPQSAAAIQSMIEAANRPSKGILAGVIGIASLMLGATGVLSELKTALNKIWRTEERGDLKEIVKKNVVFLGMLLGMGFLLTVSLILSAAISAMSQFFTGLLPATELLLHATDYILSVGCTAVMFAAIYRFLPNTNIEWSDVWVGAIVTSFLFNIGKLALGLYLGKSAVTSSYGAAGSVLILLLWVYYSGLICYFGAEFTKVYSYHYGSRKKSKPSRFPHNSANKVGNSSTAPQMATASGFSGASLPRPESGPGRRSAADILWPRARHD